MDKKTTPCPVPLELQKEILAKPCLVCGNRAIHIGIYVPPDWINIQQSDGEKRSVAYPICEGCLSPDKIEKTASIAESIIVFDLSPEETKH